jgi:hypothetical protein
MKLRDRANRQTVPQGQFDRSSISVQENKRRAATRRWTGTPEYADGRTKSGSKKDDRKV